MRQHFWYVKKRFIIVSIPRKSLGEAVCQHSMTCPMPVVAGAFAANSSTGIPATKGGPVAFSAFNREISKIMTAVTTSVPVHQPMWCLSAIDLMERQN